MDSSQFPTPPTSRDTTPSLPPTQPQDNLFRTLDTLLERYLHLLDQHQQLQSQLGAQLSSGFLSLAEANFSSPSRMRYGRDFYDGRMKAGRRLSIKLTPSSSEGYSFTTTADSSIEPAQAIDTKETTKPNGPSIDILQDGISEKRDSETTAESKPNTKSYSRDPLRWFGILVPPALRSAQTAFVAAVKDPIPKLASVMAEMRDVEEEVERLRGEIAKVVGVEDE